VAAPEDMRSRRKSSAARNNSGRRTRKKPDSGTQTFKTFRCTHVVALRFIDKPGAAGYDGMQSGIEPKEKNMSIFEKDLYAARRKFFALAGQVYVNTPDGALVCYVKQKLFKLKEEITVFADEAQTRPLVQIKARQIIDFSAAYDVTESSSGRKIGALKRKGLKSIIKDEWMVMNANDEVVARLTEKSGWGAFASRMISLIPQKYSILSQDGRELATINQRFAFFVHKFDINLSQLDASLDRDLAMASTILLLLIEGRQG